MKKEKVLEIQKIEAEDRTRRVIDILTAKLILKYTEGEKTKVSWEEMGISSFLGVDKIVIEEIIRLLKERAWEVSEYSYGLEIS